MILTYEQVVQRIKEPNADLQQELRRALAHDQRCAMHTEPEEDTSNIPYLPTFKDWVKKLLTKDKYEVFEHLLTTPFATVETTNGILDELKKVFETQDRFVKYDFSSPKLLDDWEQYREDIGETTFWQTKGFKTMKSAVNSFVIVDLPEQQNGNLPEPYFYLLRPDYVWDTMLKTDGSLEYLIIKAGGFFYVFDDASYRKVGVEDPYPLLAEVGHDLGYTPASTFWESNYNEKSRIQKQNPITNSLGRLDSLLYAITSNDHLEQYAGFPVMIGYEEKCDYVDEAGNACEGGMVVAITHGTGESVQKACPKCSTKKNIFGPGTILFAPAPASKDDPDLIDGFKFVQPSIESLNWMTSNIDSKISWLTYNMIGVPDEVTSMAINEKQVVSQFESRVNVLNEVRDNFERIQKFTEDTIARLRYGQAFKGSTIKYGDRYFLHSVDEMKKRREESKKAGASMYELSSQRMEIIEAIGKNNHLLKQRLTILSHLEPYPDLSTTELVELIASVPLDKELIRMKANFASYIDRFEREYGEIVSFFQFVDLKTKIDFINEVIFGYIAEETIEEPEPMPNPGGLPPDES